MEIEIKTVPFTYSYLVNPLLPPDRGVQPALAVSEYFVLEVHKSQSTNHLWTTFKEIKWNYDPNYKPINDHHDTRIEGYHPALTYNSRTGKFLLVCEEKYRDSTRLEMRTGSTFDRKMGFVPTRFGYQTYLNSVLSNETEKGIMDKKKKEKARHLITPAIATEELYYVVACGTELGQLACCVFKQDQSTVEKLEYVDGSAQVYAYGLSPSIALRFEQIVEVHTDVNRQLWITFGDMQYGKINWYARGPLGIVGTHPSIGFTQMGNIALAYVDAFGRIAFRQLNLAGVVVENGVTKKQVEVSTAFVYEQGSAPALACKDDTISLMWVSGDDVLRSDSVRRDNQPRVIDYQKSYYGTVQNTGNKLYLYNQPDLLSPLPRIPKCLFKMLSVAPDIYALQNQDNYEYFQSDMTRFNQHLYGRAQEWIIKPSGNGQTIQNRETHAYMDASGSGGGKIWSIVRYDCQETRAWMEDNISSIANKPLHKICMPGSHDAGTFMSTYITHLASDRITRTQLFDIQFQLMQGVRVFDLRPVLHEGEFHTAHYNKLKFVGYQGAIGVKLKAVLEQVSAFLSMHRKELVILNFSHFLNWDKRDDAPDLTIQQQQQLKELIQETLGGKLICGSGKDMFQKPLADLYAHGNVIAVFQEGVTIDKNDPKSGIWSISALNMKGGYANTDNLEKMQKNQLEKLKQNGHADKSPFLFELCWQLTLSLTDNLPTGRYSILDLAETANPTLYPTVESWLNSKIINQNVYPNIINTDACYEDLTHAVKLCMLINKMIRA